MIRLLQLLIFCAVLAHSASAQHTFSIVAVDPATGEVGAAGATCLNSADCGGCGGAIVINQLVPGVGGINAQATVCLPNVNLNNGIQRLEQGDSPQQTLDWLLDNDGCQFGTTADRQYGIADLGPDNAGRAVGYTGSQALNAAGHRSGQTYSIQGNILLEDAILDSMEARFLAATGTLAERLMAGLQGANVPGADSRCLDEGTSSRSAFLRVARPNDAPNDFFLDLNVPGTPTGVEPIDSLQALLDLNTVSTVEDPFETAGLRIAPNPSHGRFVLSFERLPGGAATVEVFNVHGKRVFSGPVTGRRTEINLEGSPGMHVVRVSQTGRTLGFGRVLVF